MVSSQWRNLAMQPVSMCLHCAGSVADFLLTLEGGFQSACFEEEYGPSWCLVLVVPAGGACWWWLPSGTLAVVPCAELSLIINVGCVVPAVCLRWADGVASRWKTIARNVHSRFRRAQRLASAAQLAEATGHDAAACAVALEESKDDASAAYEWLLTHVADADADANGDSDGGGAGESKASEVVALKVPRRLQPLDGVFTSSLGRIKLVSSGQVVGIHATMTMPKGSVLGFATQGVDRQWKFQGAWHQADVTQPGHCEVLFDEACDSFTVRAGSSSCGVVWCGVGCGCVDAGVDVPVAALHRVDGSQTALGRCVCSFRLPG